MPVQLSRLPACLPVGIVHLGLGAFHRAHQAACTEDAINLCGGNWGICAVAMRSRKLAQDMRKSGGRYSLIEQRPDGPCLKELSVIREVLFLPDEPEAVASRLADPGVHVVTITVTEKGYCFTGSDRQLNDQDPLIIHDLANPSRPVTLPGILVMGLQQRRRSSGSGLSILSCDNLPENGRVLQQIILSHASRVDEDLATWIATECRFPGSMVDRITPAASEATFRVAERLLGRPDPAAIETEPFSQWVIEDRFAGPHPEWDKAGAQLVDDVAPFESMKLRMLNGSHSLIAYLGAITGLPAVRDVMAQPVYHALVKRHMTDAATTLDKVAERDRLRYGSALIERFENPAIDHRCLQIAMDGSQKLPQRIFTPARLRLDYGLPVDTFALATALWFRYLVGINELGERIACNDPRADELTREARGDDDIAIRLKAIGCLPGISTGLFEYSEWISQVATLAERLEAEGTNAVVASIIEK